MLVALNVALRRQRRRLVVVGATLALAGAVVAAHGVMAGDHMGEGAVMCLAVAETAVLAIGAAVAGIASVRPLLAVPATAVSSCVRHGLPLVSTVAARAGPAGLQVFRQ